jgi:hypothetical protein
MSKGATLDVLFIGYMAQIENRQRIVYARIDFISGHVILEADGGHVHVRRIRDLRPFVASPRQGINELKKRADDECCKIEVSDGENKLFVEPGADLDQVILHLTERCSKTESVLRQALKVGLKVKRRPYHEHIDEIEKTGIIRLEFHGIGVFKNNKLSVRLDRREILMKCTGRGEYIILSESTGSAGLH